MKKYKEYLLF